MLIRPPQRRAEAFSKDGQGGGHYARAGDGHRQRAFIESASGSDASGGSCLGSDDAEDTNPAASPPCARGGDDAVRGEEHAGKGFSLRSVLALELSWYTSPEDADDSGATFASDMYRLGVHMPLKMTATLLVIPLRS
jgi:hypothetical protein